MASELSFQCSAAVYPLPPSVDSDLGALEAALQPAARAAQFHGENHKRMRTLLYNSHRLSRNLAAFSPSHMDPASLRAVSLWLVLLLWTFATSLLVPSVSTLSRGRISDSERRNSIRTAVMMSGPTYSTGTAVVVSHSSRCCVALVACVAPALLRVVDGSPGCLC